jgi:hypothetical protein
MILVDRPPNTSETKLPPSYESEKLPLLPNLPYRLTADDIAGLRHRKRLSVQSELQRTLRWMAMVRQTFQSCFARR